MTYAAEQLTPDDIQSLTGSTVLEFGTNWCGVCMGAQSRIQQGLGDATVTHIKVEDGPGRRLGRSFRVKLWPTLVFLRDGIEVSRVVRPRSAEQVATALAELVDP